jgi:beta-galactosidase
LNPIHDNRGAWLRAALHCLLAACAVILAALQLAHVGTP